MFRYDINKGHDFVETKGTVLELQENRRVFEVVVDKPGGLIFREPRSYTVAANSFEQAASAAIEHANEIRDIYLTAVDGDESMLENRYQTPFSPADVRSISVLRTGLVTFQHLDK